MRRLNAAIVKSIHTPEVTKTLEDSGLNIIANTPEEFVQQIKAGFAIYEKAIKVAQLKPE